MASHSPLGFKAQGSLLRRIELLTDYESEVFDRTDLSCFREQLSAFLAQPIKHKYFVYVIVIEDHVEGVIILERQADSKWYFEITCLAIAKAKRGQKLGQLLMKESIAHIKKHGAAYLFLKTSGARYNQTTEHFYEKFGFRKLGALPNYYVDQLPHQDRIVENCQIYYKNI